MGNRLGACENNKQNMELCCNETDRNRNVQVFGRLVNGCGMKAVEVGLSALGH